MNSDGGSGGIWDSVFLCFVVFAEFSHKAITEMNPGSVGERL